MEPVEVLLLLAITGIIAFTFGRYRAGNRFTPLSAGHNARSGSRIWLAVTGAVSLVTAMIFAGAGDTAIPRLAFAVYWLCLPGWVFLDARIKGERAWAWGLMAFFTNILGLVSYLIARPEKERLCPRCAIPLRTGFRVCPYCGPLAGYSCPSCQEPLESGWIYCPYCRIRISDTAPEAGIDLPSLTGMERPTAEGPGAGPEDKVTRPL